MHEPRRLPGAIAIAAALFALATTTAAAQPVLIQPTGQTRTVSSDASAQDLGGPVNDSDSDQAVGFAPFVSNVSALASLTTAEGTGGGIQSSEIRDDSIIASGSAAATAESFEEDGVADGSGSSIVIVDFTLLTEAHYMLQGPISGFDNGDARLILRNAAGEIFREDAAGGTIDIDESGTLPAGDYTLEVRASASANADFPFASEFAFAEYDLTLQFSIATVPVFGPASLAALALLLGAMGSVAASRP